MKTSYDINLIVTNYDLKVLNNALTEYAERNIGRIKFTAQGLLYMIEMQANAQRKRG